MTRIGTSHFASLAAAVRYYAHYGYSRKDVAAKLAAGEIHIGRPQCGAGQSAGIIKGEGRWYLIEEASAQVPMGKIA